MPRIKITKLPKYVLGGGPPICPTGQMPDPNNPEECIDDPNYGSSNPSNVPRVENNKNKLVATAPAGYGKDYTTMSLTPTINQSGLTGGVNWNVGNTDISGNSTVAATPVNLEAPTTYKLDPNQTGPKVGLFECPKGYRKDQNGKCVKKTGFFDNMTDQQILGWGANTAGLLLTGANAWATDKANRERKRAYDRQFRYAQFNPALDAERDKGNWTVDAQRTFQPNMQPPVNEGMMNSQYGGVTPIEKTKNCKD